MTEEVKTGRDAYARVTEAIIAALEDCTATWSRPWITAARSYDRPRRANGECYRGVNTLLLWNESIRNDYQSPTWMTVKQANSLGGTIRKGQRGSLVVYASAVTVGGGDGASTGEEDGADAKSKTIPWMKGYTVFNVGQIDGLPAEFRPIAREQQTINPDAREPRLDAFVAMTGATIVEGGNRAFYRTTTDDVHMPVFEQFTNAHGYYGTLLHELTHWTGHESRLDRKFGKRFGDNAYAFEELVAEIGSAFLCSDLGVPSSIPENHAPYLSSWLEVLRADKRAIFTAAAAAQKAADWVLNVGSKQDVSEASSEPVAEAAEVEPKVATQHNENREPFELAAAV